MDDSALLAIPICFLPAAVLSAVLTPLARRAALWANLVAPVRPDRLHGEPRPLGGGLAILAAVSLTVAGFAALVGSYFCDRPNRGVWAEGAAWAVNFMPFLPGLAIGAVLFFMIGLIDDRYAMAAVPKLILQTLAASVVVLAAGIKATAWLTVPGAPQIVSILWIIAVVNAYNMLDHADGLAAAVGFLMLVSLAIGQAMLQEKGVALVAGAAAGAIAGFLLYNFPPARLFMGDAGSMLVGYLLAALTMAGRYYFAKQGASKLAVLIPLAILAVPLFDAACVTAGRIRRRESPLKGDATSHLAHRMLARGWRPRAVVLVAAAMAAVTGAASVAMYRLSGPALVAPWLAVTAVLALMLYLRRPASSASSGAGAAP